MTREQADRKWTHWTAAYQTAKTISDTAVTEVVKALDKVRQELNSEFGTTEWTGKFYTEIA
jgi:hypothetical protein